MFPGTPHGSTLAPGPIARFDQGSYSSSSSEKKKYLGETRRNANLSRIWWDQGMGMNREWWDHYVATLALPIGSMYAIYGNIYHQYTPMIPNVSIYIYTIHGSYGLYNMIYLSWYGWVIESLCVSDVCLHFFQPSASWFSVNAGVSFAWRRIATCGHPRKKKKNKKRLGLAGEGNPAVKTIWMPSMLEFYRHVMW